MRIVAVLGVGLLALAACSKKDDKAPEASASASASASGADASASAGPVALPKRKPGLWSHTVAASGAAQQMQICIDADTDAKMSLWGQAVGKDMCSKNAVTARPGGGYAFESECDMGNMGRVVSKGEVTGDFSSAYTVRTTSTTTGSSMPQANTTSEMTLTAKWEGACPAGMQGGDITLPGGVKINMESMAVKK